jgi:hypothetical protein
MDASIRLYLSKIGRRGGRKSRRALSSDTARQMVRLREARRAFERFKTSCFWSFDPNQRLTVSDVPWIAGELRKHGSREAWEVAARLCR